MAIPVQHVGPWHAMALPAIWQALQATAQGLTHREAAARLRTYGPNQLTGTHRLGHPAQAISESAPDVFVKGAPERVLAMCDRTGEPQAVAALHHVAEVMGQQGYRVLALAESMVPHPLDPSRTPPEPGTSRSWDLSG